MSMMKAIAVSAPGGASMLRLVEIPRPEPGPGEILIEIGAAGVNRPDILQREGHYPPPPGAPETLGLEVAGQVAGLGEGVKRYKIGDKVCALVAGGGYADYCVAAEDNSLPLPEGLTVVEAAGLPETSFTVWTNVFQRGQLKPGETLLIHGGTSGIGTMAIQLAKAFGARVVATAGGPAKCQACQALGADLAIDYRAEDFVAVLKMQAIAPDVILDMVGGDYVERNLRCLALEGRLVNIAFQKGSRVELDLMPVMLKRQTMTGSTLRSRSVAQKAEIARELEAKLWPLLKKGLCKPQIFRTFPLAEAADAHSLLEMGHHIGKIILTP